MMFLKILTLIAILYFESVISVRSCSKGYKFCVTGNVTEKRCCCKQFMAVCQNNGKHLTYIPPLPPDITDFTFRGNHLYSIHDNSFANISNLKLSKLQIVDCKVTNISGDAFASLTSLRELHLDNNKEINQSQLARALGSIQKTSKITLFLKNIGLTEVQPHLLQHITDANLTKLILDDNSLTALNFKAFENLSKLETLSVKTNIIRWIDFENGHRALQRLLLVENEIARYVPPFCLKGQRENLFPNLRSLDLSNNFISELRSSPWSCLKKLESLKLSGNVVRKIHANTFSGLTNLYKLTLSDMAGYIKEIESYAFNNSRLEALTLADNSINFRKQDSARLFRGCLNLKTLIISGNSLDTLTDQELLDMFSPLKTLKVITAVNCKIKEIPYNLVHSLKYLNKINFDQNRIDSLGNFLFNVGNLSTLNMQSNKIKTLLKENFPMDIAAKLDINLALNPFDCTCDLLWFRSNVEDNGMIGNIKLVNWDWKRMYTCATPISRSNKRVFDYKPTVISCQNILLISVICVSSLAIIVTVIATVSYRYRMYIQLWYYKRKRGKRIPETQPLLGAEAGRFNGYVIYDTNDEAFVYNDFRILVEQKMAYKLKLWERDAAVGRFTLEEMVDSIYDCEAVIAVISKAALKNEHVRFQLKVALDRQVEIGREILLLVLLEDLVYRDMSNYWCVMLTRVPAARWSADEAGMKRKVFEEQLQQHFDNNAVGQNNIQ